MNDYLTLVDLKELMVTWSNLTRSLWKKKLFFNKFVAKMETPASAIEKCVAEIIMEQSSGSVCRLSSSSAAFILLCLDAVPVSNETLVVDCVLKLLPCIEYSLASKMELVHLKNLQVNIKCNDYASLQSLHFFPSVKVDWTAFSKFLSELKGCPQQFLDLLPFLGNFFNFNTSTPELFDIVDRLARRNSAASAALLYQTVQCDKFADCLDLYAPVFEVLVPVDNEIVREFMAKISKIIVISPSLVEKLMKSFSAASVKAKENISKFLAECFANNKPESISTNFADYAAKELSSEVILAALIQCSAYTNSEALTAFLKTNLNATQKMSVKSSIMLGIAKSGNFSSITDEIMKEIFSTSFLKEATAAGTLHSQIFFTCSLAALVDNPNFLVDSKLLNDSLMALTKPAGPAVLSEKGWSSMDFALVDILLSQVILPVLFFKDKHNAMLLNYAISAFAWFIVNGSKACSKLIRKHAHCFSIENMDLLASALEKYLDGGSEAKAHNVWAILNLICSNENLASRSLALLCHDKTKLLGLGAGSWAELIRSQCNDIDEFCRAHVEKFINQGNLFSTNDTKTSAFYLLETMISLSPSLVNGTLRPFEAVSDAFDELNKFTPAQWSLLTSKPVAIKAAAVSTSKNSTKSASGTPTSDDIAVKESLLKSIAKLKHSVSVTRAVALALPFHQVFSDIRPLMIVKLLQNIPLISDSSLVGFLVASAYEIATDSLNSQGSLLISLYLRSCEMESLVSSSWSISDTLSLLDSVFKIVASNAEVSEISFVALVLSKALTPASKTLFDTIEFKNLLDSLKKLCEKCDCVDSNVILGLVQALLDISPLCPTSIQASIVLLLVEIGEIPKLEICNEQNLLNLNCCLRSSLPATQLMVLKFLTAFAASHSNAHCLLECSELLKTVWLLHFTVFQDVKDQQQTAEDAEFDDLEGSSEHTTSKAYEVEEVTSIAAELCSLLQLTDISFNVLDELSLLETEKGEKEFQVKNLVEHYIAALGASLKSADALISIANELRRLLAARTTPNGIVRLTKNLDRSKLDFTKQTRKALLRAVSTAAKDQHACLLPELVAFCFETGFNDCDEANCEIVFSMALSIIEECAGASTEALYELLQKYLSVVPADNDRIKVYAVILLGRTSSRVPSLTSSPARVWELVERIKESLNIPSERVQKAVADTLVPLFRSQKEDKRISALAFGFTSRLREAKEDYGALRGAAFGLAALIEACGTALIRSHEIFTLLLEGLAKLNQKGSEAVICSSLASIEIISIRCGIVFEPYIAPLVPGVLEALGDSRQRVREDAEACADAMMSALSPLSVSLILPPLLDMAGMDGCDPRYSWRAKLGAVTWLGSMACLAPKVLTPALPKIIPALIVALTDAHEKVHLAAHHALAVKYAAIIRSPEIKAALPAILRALSDPPRFASACLGDIIGTSFCHAVDGPSLALLEPLLSRALRERGTGAMSEAKRRAILIIANLGSLMDPAELRPYLVNLVPALRGVLGDAVPQVRSGSARALGVMMRLMHSNNLAQDCPVLMNIVPECLETIFSTLPSVTSIDRAGAAQAIAQVTAARGLDQLIQLVNERVAPVLFSNDNNSPSSGTGREALLHLCAALPTALPPTEIPKLYERVFTRDRLYSILQGTASEDEGVREISTKTIRSLLLRKALFVNLQESMEILLKGSADGRWRLRLTSFTILSDLLPVLSMSTEASTCDTQNRSLSGEMRARVLSRLFFGRFDSNGLIRNTAFSLWKSIVTHPPRVILEILPVLVDDCVASLEIIDDDGEEEEDDDDEEYESDSDSGSECESETEDSEAGTVGANVKVDRYEMASTALQDILVKLSDRVLLPFLRRLTQLFTSSSGSDEKLPGILLAARIVTSVVLVPNLIPPHQRSVNSAPVVVVPRAQIDEALKLVLNLTQQGLITSERTVKVAVGLFSKIAMGLASSPVLLDRIISELFLDSSENSDALISVLNRRPQILLPSLVTRFKKISNVSEVDWEWWSEVFAAPGPFIASHAPSLIIHAVKLLNDRIDDHLEFFDALLASMAAYDPEILYGDAENDNDEDEEDLEDSVETGLFSFGQFLETLWSARNLPLLASQLISRFTQQGCYGLERFFDIWLDRLLVASVCGANEHDVSIHSVALEGIIEGAIERDEASAVISQLNQTIETRSSVSKQISSKLPSNLVLLIIKSLCLPIVSNSSISSSDRFDACTLLQSVLLSSTNSPAAGNLKALAPAAATALLGALIRCLSDRSDTLKTERLKAALLPILLEIVKELPAVGKPFHPQLARLGVNVLKDLIASVSISGNVVDFDPTHPRGDIGLITCQLVSLLLVQMSRVEVLLEELTTFRIDSDDSVYDELSTRNARKVLLHILGNLRDTPVDVLSVNLSNFITETVKKFMVLPSSEIEIIRETAEIGLKLSEKMAEGPALKTYINNLI